MKQIKYHLLTVLFLLTIIQNGNTQSLVSSQSEMRDYIISYQADNGALSRKYAIKESDEYYSRFSQLHSDWLKLLKTLSFEAFSQNGKVDYILLKNAIEREDYNLQQNKREFDQIKSSVRFGANIMPLVVLRRNGAVLDGSKTAATFNELRKEIKANQQEIEKLPKYSERLSTRAAAAALGYKMAVRDLFKFYNEYDPQFGWWMNAPYTELDTTLGQYIRFLKNWKTNDVLKDDGSGIIGNPIGRDEIIKSLEFEMISYNPEELIEIANKEFAWCEREMLKASTDMGFGDHWKEALEKVKNDYVEEGKQPALAKFLAEEGADYVETNNLVTVPPLAREVWRMTMMTAEGQRFAPFFLGGEVLQIAYPTSTMQEEDKMMTMRGNNKHFSRAVVYHELIPGHHLQQFMNSRYNSHRRYFSTSFSIEGWALYWEMVLWDRNFQKSPENRVGMLFWRMHRCARIIFSLNYHMNKWTPQQCVDFLVDKVGHERANASAEVRRSFTGGYGPLYQLSYMVGAKQFYALRGELVNSGKMKEKEFHDAILQNGPISVEMMRALLSNQSLNRDFKTSWKFK
ncbi:DUF885 family protein [soil metagenome]